MLNVKFEMSLWLRIKAACGVWWAIVVTKELECADDDIEELESALKKIKAIEDDWDNCIPECNVCAKVQLIAEQVLQGEHDDNRKTAKH